MHNETFQQAILSFKRIVADSKTEFQQCDTGIILFPGIIYRYEI